MVFAADVVAVDPMMVMISPMAGHPDHFVFATPVARAMGVIWLVTDFDADPCRLDGGPESETRGADRGEQ